MLEWAGSSLQDETLLRAEGLMAGPPSLNWDETLLILEEMGSGRSAGGLTAMRWRQSSCGRERHRQISRRLFAQGRFSPGNTGTNGKKKKKDLR